MEYITLPNGKAENNGHSNTAGTKSDVGASTEKVNEKVNNANHTFQAKKEYES